MRHDFLKYHRGTGLRLLFTQLDKELIRAAVMIAGVCLVFLITYLI